MNSVKLVLSKLLGFKILPAVAGPDRAEPKAKRNHGSKIGSKIGRGKGPNDDLPDTQPGPLN